MDKLSLLQISERNKERREFSTMGECVQTHRGAMDWSSKGGGEGRGKQGVWDQCTHTTIYKVDDQQGPCVKHRELYPVFCNSLYGERI